MSASEERAAKLLEEIGSDIDLDVEKIGRSLAKSASSPGITFFRLKMILEVAEDSLKNKQPKPSSKHDSAASRAQRLIDQATEGSGRELVSILKNHGYEDVKCELCDWIASNSSEEWLNADEWVYEALLRNQNTTDNLLSKILDIFESAPGAWGIASEIEYHQNASSKTIARAQAYSNGTDWD